ncbi:MAG: hypothetical protein AAGC55_15155 [Myxococcota bacterium]
MNARLANWDDLPFEEQALYRDLYQLLVDPPKPSLWERVRGAWLMLRIGPDAVQTWITVFARFTDKLQEIQSREQRAFARIVNDPTVAASIEQGWHEFEAGKGIPLQEALAHLEQN